MRRLPFIAASACVVFGASLIGYAVFAPDAGSPNDVLSCPDGMAQTTGASGLGVCVRGVTLSADSDLKCPQGHVALSGVAGRTICTPGVEASAPEPG